MFSIFRLFNLEVVGLAVMLWVVGLVGVGGVAVMVEVVGLAAGWGGRGGCDGWGGQGGCGGCNAWGGQGVWGGCNVGLVGSGCNGWSGWDRFLCVKEFYWIVDFIALPNFIELQLGPKVSPTTIYKFPVNRFYKC